MSSLYSSRRQASSPYTGASIIMCAPTTRSADALLFPNDSAPTPCVISEKPAKNVQIASSTISTRNAPYALITAMALSDDRGELVSRGAGALAMSDPVRLLRHIRHQQHKEASGDQDRYRRFAGADVAARPVECRG